MGLGVQLQIADSRLATETPEQVKYFSHKRAVSRGSTPNIVAAGHFGEQASIKSAQQCV